MLHHPTETMSRGEPRYRDEILKVPYWYPCHHPQLGADHVEDDVRRRGGERTFSIETTTLVENMVRDQTMQLLVVAGELAARRGQSKFTIDDILFQVRHNPGRLTRLRNYMRWKEVRKKAKVKDDEAANDLDFDEADELIEEDYEPEVVHADRTKPADAISEASTPKAHNLNKPCSTSHPRSSIAPLPWSILAMFPHASDIPALASLANDENSPDNTDLYSLLGNGSSSSGTTNPWLLARLLKNDERTRNMTAAEYTTWSDCRSASFTYRKKKTFREWCGMGVIADHRAKDDVLETLGFLASEWVQVLTEQALAVKKQEEQFQRLEMTRSRAGLKRKFGGDGTYGVQDDERGNSLDDVERERMPKNPIQPRHVRRAFEILQRPPKKYTAMMHGTQLRQRKRLRIF